MQKEEVPVQAEEVVPVDQVQAEGEPQEAAQDAPWGGRQRPGME
jgi:hypothetical protein